MANLRMSPVALAHLVQAYFGLETIIHLTCRDRNVLALQSELLGAAALGINNVLTLTGDPPTRGDHPDAKGVYEVDVLGLIRLVNCLNQGKSGGRDLDVTHEAHRRRCRQPKRQRFRSGGLQVQRQVGGRCELLSDATDF